MLPFKKKYIAFTSILTPCLLSAFTNNVQAEDLDLPSIEIHAPKISYENKLPLKHQ